jgi:hypothetical protein
MGAPSRRAGRLFAITLCGVVAWICTSLGSAGAAPGPAGVAVEEVLRQAARVTWTEDGVAAHRLQRGTRGDDGAWVWTDVSAAGDGGRAGYLIDRGPDAKGLAPGVYAYRVQSALPGGGWSEGSAPAELTMPPQCAGGDNPPGNEAPASLQTVEIGDLNGDGRYTGADVWSALQRCSKLGGCVLEALPVTYDDVAITLYGINHDQDDFPCKFWNALICEPIPPFPKGLVIQGHGSATIFRSPVWKTPYRPSPIFEIWHAPGVQLRFRNFTMDGRKKEQPDPEPGKNNAYDWRHRGIDVTHVFGKDQTRRYPDGCVHNLTVRDFMLSGVDIDHVRNWRVEYNRVQDAGCWTGLTDCPRLTIPDVAPPPAWGCAGLKSGGYGLVVQAWSEDTIVAHNEVTRASKYAYGFKGGADGTIPVTRLTAVDNRATNIGGVGIFVAGTIDSVVERNLVDGTHQYGCRAGGAWNSWGIQTHGTIRNTLIKDNTLRNLSGVGIGSNAVADGLVFENNTIDNACTERNAKVDSIQGAIHFGDGSAGTFTLENNQVTHNQCSMALAVCWGSQAQVTVDGGYYSTGDNAHETYGALYVESGNSPRWPLVKLKGGVQIDYPGSPKRRPGIVASGNGKVVVEDASVQVKGFTEKFATAQSRMDESTVQKTGAIVQCASNPARPECQ